MLSIIIGFCFYDINITIWLLDIFDADIFVSLHKKKKIVSSQYISTNNLLY